MNLTGIISQLEVVSVQFHVENKLPTNKGLCPETASSVPARWDVLVFWSWPLVDTKVSLRISSSSWEKASVNVKP